MVIVLDDDVDTKSPVSAQLGSSSSAAANGLYDIEGASPPPAYYDSESTPLQYPYDVPPSRPMFKRGEPAFPRFWKAFFVAWGLWLLFCALIAVDIEITVDHGRWVSFCESNVCV